MMRRSIEKEVNTERNRNRGKKGERYSCWLINNAWFIQNQLGFSTQNTFCIMTSLALSLVQQAHYSRPKNPANNRAAEPSPTVQD